MYIEQKSKNCYRVRMMKHGKKYTLTFDHKPTNREAMLELYKMVDEENVTTSDSLYKCCKMYADSKSETLSPNSYRTYYRYINSIPEEYAKIQMANYNELKYQQLINNYASNHSPKTVKAFNGFLLSVFKMFTKKSFSATLPQIKKKELYIPTLEEVQLIIDNAPPRYKVIFMLASYGLRFGEIKALTLEDIKDDYIDVNKTEAYGLHYKKFVKSPKTFESTRQVKVPKKIIKKIRKLGLSVPTESRCVKMLYKIQAKLKLPKFTIHRFRHFFATYLHNQNVPSVVIQKMGGWATDNIMKSVYTHCYNREEQFIIPLH